MILLTLLILRRACYFDGERKLRFFKLYTQTNCFHECKSNYSAELCKCVHVGMPRDKKTDICSNKDVQCMMSVFWLFDDDSKPSVKNCKWLCCKLQLIFLNLINYILKSVIHLVRALNMM